jgi:hypothetical protein
MQVYIQRGSDEFGVEPLPPRITLLRSTVIWVNNAVFTLVR